MYYRPVETGKRIMNRRKEAKLTQEQFANKLGISDRHLRNIEAGEQSISFLVAIIIIHKEFIS